MSWDNQYYEKWNKWSHECWDNWSKAVKDSDKNYNSGMYEYANPMKWMNGETIAKTQKSLLEAQLRMLQDCTALVETALESIENRDETDRNH